MYMLKRFCVFYLSCEGITPRSSLTIAIVHDTPVVICAVPQNVSFHFILRYAAALDVVPMHFNKVIPDGRKLLHSSLAEQYKSFENIGVLAYSTPTISNL